MTKRLRVTYLFAALVVGLLSAFPQVGHAQATDKLKLRMASVPAGLHPGLFLAKARGWLPNLEIEDGTGSVAALNMLAAGQADIAEASIATMITARARGLPFKAIACWFPANDLGVMVHQDSPIKTPKDLEGKKVAYAAASLEGPFVVPFIKASGADPSRVELVNMDFAARFSAFMSGQADGLVSVVPYAISILKKANKPARAILFSDYGFNLPSTGYVVSEEALRTKKAALQEIVTAVHRAWTEVWSNPVALDEAVEAMVKLRPSAKIDAANIKDQLQNYRNYYYTANTKGKPIGWIAREDISAALKTMKDASVLTTSSTPDEYFTNEFFQN